jgi:hypothetical protein
MPMLPPVDGGVPMLPPLFGGAPVAPPLGELPGDPPPEGPPPEARPPGLDPDAPPVDAEALPDALADPPSLVAVEKRSLQATAKPAKKTQVPLDTTGGA